MTASDGTRDALFLEGPVLVVVAHPDDEVIGFSAHLVRLGARCSLIHLTAGAPRDPRFAGRAGHASREAYAEARRREALAAAGLAGIPEQQCFELGLLDQEASLHLVSSARLLRDRIGRLVPRYVITHPYEGGHPDHDAAAFSVHLAVELLRRDGAPAPPVMELTSYHGLGGERRTFEFLPAAPGAVHTIVLDARQRLEKQRMYDCFETQRRLAPFPIGVERWRGAPRYDFTRPPHPGQLYYEGLPCGMTGERWVGLARAALDELDVRAPTAQG